MNVTATRWLIALLASASVLGCASADQSGHVRAIVDQVIEGRENPSLDISKAADFVLEDILERRYEFIPDTHNDIFAWIKYSGRYHEYRDRVIRVCEMRPVERPEVHRTVDVLAIWDALDLVTAESDEEAKKLNAARVSLDEDLWLQGAAIINLRRLAAWEYTALVVGHLNDLEANPASSQVALSGLAFLAESPQATDAACTPTAKLWKEYESECSRRAILLSSCDELKAATEKIEQRFGCALGDK